MANYSTLKAAVADVVKTNGTQAITGANLQAVLLSIINSVGGGGYIFKGVATPSTDAGTPDENVFYIGGAGTYANFGTSVTVPVGSIGVFKYNGSWTKETITVFAGIDDVPTANSNNLVKSGGVYNEVNQLGSYMDNPEFVRVYTDEDRRLLWGIKKDGTIYYGAGVPPQVTEAIDALNVEIQGYLNNKVDKAVGESLINETFANGVSIVSNPQYVFALVDSENHLLVGIHADGTLFLGAGIPKQISDALYKNTRIVSSKEYIKATIDSDERVLDAITPNGEEHHYTKHHFEGGIGLDKESLMDLEQALKDDGFTSGTGDWSDEPNIELPIPRVCAKVNIISSALPSSKTDDLTGQLEFWDKDGNYFKKDIEALNIQGDTSAAMPKKNYGFDFSDAKIKFGDWVFQDSFHLKKYYIDAFRGQSIVAYRLCEQVYQTHEFGNRKPYEYLYHNTDMDSSNGSFSKDFPTGALTHPDGFPIMLYHNGTLLGLYAWALKKNRDNYAMKKNTQKNIILDGKLGASELWGGSVNWTQFEVRNPKVSTDINGNPYDGDNPTEPSNDYAEMKGYVTRLSGAITTINAESTTIAKRTKFEEYFMVDFLIDYFLLGQVLGDFDGFWKNWIWCSWDGSLWCPTYYDKDAIFGSSAQGSCVNESLIDKLFGLSSNIPSDILYSLYRNEIETRYKELRDNGIFSENNIISLLNDWIKACGYDNIKIDLEELCPETPSYRDPKLNQGWKIIGSATNPSVSTYDPSVTYQIGDTCDYCNPATPKVGLKFEATAVTQGVAPLSGFYSYLPTEGGYFNSPQRVYNWLVARLAYLDTTFNY